MTAERPVVKPRLPSIPDYRSGYIDLRLQEFLDSLGIAQWPIDCVKLLSGMRDSDKYRIRIGYAGEEVSDGLDAATNYVQRLGMYQIVLSRSKIRYPYRKSSDRRLNFTIAHEIGHIVLEHLLVPNHCKTKEEIRMEDLEADEFAARLLMPQKLLYSFNYYSVDAVASFLNVSNTALRMRLIHLDATHLIRARKVKSCIRCGNTRFSEFAQYCGVCGQSTAQGCRGIRRIYYPDEYPIDSFKRALVCPKCHRDIRHGTGDRCPFCGTCIFNFCSGFFDPGGSVCSCANPGYARYCEVCGRPTYYQEINCLKDWQDCYTIGMAPDAEHRDANYIMNGKFMKGRKQE